MGREGKWQQEGQHLLPTTCSGSAPATRASQGNPGDGMSYIDGTMPLIIGTGAEDYHLGA